MGNEIVEFLKNIVDPVQMYTLLALAGAHIFVGVFGAMIRGEFDKNKFIEFYRGKVGVFFCVYIAAGIIANVLTDWSAFQGVVFAGLCTVYTDRILERLNEWGLPVPRGIPVVNGFLNGLGAPARKVLNKKKQ